MNRRKIHSADSMAVHYRIVPTRPEAHLFEVTLTVAQPDPSGQCFALPVWIPGSYLVREFARNVVSIGARGATDRQVALTKLDKRTWRAQPVPGPLVVNYLVYSSDPSVRAAHLDTTRGFFNGTSVFLEVAGQKDALHTVEIAAPAGVTYAGWRVATSLRPLETTSHGFGFYEARNYDELVDCPVEMGTFQLARFQAAGVPHTIAFTGHIPHLDVERVCADLKRVCEAQIGFFEPDSKRAPFKKYLFLVNVVGEGYGGLEHRSSSALLCSRKALPVTGAAETAQTYEDFLGLASHEYFHSWNVKRIKPAAFAPYDLGQENYTSLLWIFEGFTSYYDDLILVRTGLMSAERYLDGLARTISEVLRGNGRNRQSVAQSSFDAWIKFYRPDENASNAVVSYYKKGALIALALDLTIRLESQHRHSLDDVMRALWERFGRNFYPSHAEGLSEDGFGALAAAATGLDVQRWVALWAYGTADLPLQALLASFGVSFELHPSLDGTQLARHLPLTLGVRVREHERECVVISVYDDGPAQNAGLSAGDVLVALDGLRITAENLPSLLDRYGSGQVVRIAAFRRDELMSFALTLAPESAVRCVLGTQNKGSKLRLAWLGVPDPVKVGSKAPKNIRRSNQSDRRPGSPKNVVS